MKTLARLLRAKLRTSRATPIRAHHGAAPAEDCAIWNDIVRALELGDHKSRETSR